MVDGLDRLADIQALREAAQRPPAEVQQMQPPARTQLQMVSPEAGLQNIVPGQILDENGLPVSPSPVDAVGQVTNIAGQYAMANPDKVEKFASGLSAFKLGAEAGNMIDKGVQAESEKENLDAVKDVAKSSLDRTRTNMPAMAMPVQAQEEIQVTEASPMQAGLASVMPMQAGGRLVQGIKNNTKFQNELNNVIEDQTIDPAVKRLLPFWTEQEGFLNTAKSAIEGGATKDIGFGHKLTNQERKSKRVYGIDISKPISVKEGLTIAVKDLENKLKQVKNNIPKIKKDLNLSENVRDYDQLSTNEKAALLDMEANVIGGTRTYKNFTKGILTKDKDLINDEYERSFRRNGERILLDRRNKAFEREFANLFMPEELYKIRETNLAKTASDLEKARELEAQAVANQEQFFKGISDILGGGNKKESGATGEYIVKEGDNLFTIAQATGLKLSELKESNPQLRERKEDYSLIYEGEKINLPSTSEDTNFLSDISAAVERAGKAAAKLKKGGDVGQYFEGQVEGKGDGMSDEIPFQVEGGNPDFAMLSKDEYVIPADVVAMLGNGSSNAGSDKLDDFLEDTREESFGRKEQQTQIDAEKGLSSLA